MLDRDLAALYKVETRALNPTASAFLGAAAGSFNQAVQRNLIKFPEDFMFQLSKEELENLRSQIVISNLGHGGRRYLPHAFTENGVAMLSSVLNSETAVKVNIQIMRAFTRLRNLVADNSEGHYEY
jgi:hypothetical protein